MTIAPLTEADISENTASARFHEKHGFLAEGHLHDVAVKFGRSLGVLFCQPLKG